MAVSGHCIVSPAAEQVSSSISRMKEGQTSLDQGGEGMVDFLLMKTLKIDTANLGCPLSIYKLTFLP